jgi:ABC-2 type transport system ATP-binding protein
MSGAAVSCNGLVKRFGDVVAVAGLDLEIPAGECFGLLGPNGAGKTTTVEIFEGLQSPDAGQVEILGMRWDRDERALRLRMGSQLQETQFPDKISVRECLTLFRSFYQRGPSVDEVLAVVQLGEKQASWVKHLSGGQRQRLAVGCALIGDPDILFLDEPTTGLDPQSRHQLWDVIRELSGKAKTVVLTTHYMEEAHRLCDRVGVMDHGRMIALGTPNDLIASLGGEHVVEFALRNGGDLTESDLLGLPGVQGVLAEDGATRLTVSRVHETVPSLMALLRDRGVELSELATHHATLEDVFLSLTGRHLRDE